jgi:tetratricopeptide (TPR) repeat protein
MGDYFQVHEQILNRDLDSIKDSGKKIDRILLFIVEVRSTLSGRVEYWIKRTLPLCKEVNYEKGLFALYVHLAYYYLMTSCYTLGKFYLDKASQLDWSRFLHKHEHMYFYHAHGEYYNFTDEKELSLEYYNKSLELAVNLDDIDFTCQMMNHISHLYIQDGEYQKSEDLLLEAFSLIDPEKNPFPALNIMGNLSSLYIQLDDYDKAKDYLKSALYYANEKEIDYMLPPLYFNYGLICEKQGDSTKADEFFKKAYESNGDTNFRDTIALGYTRFLLDQGRREEGKEKTLEIMELFRIKGMAGSLDKVFHLMDEYDI